MDSDLGNGKSCDFNFSTVLRNCPKIVFSKTATRMQMYIWKSQLEVATKYSIVHKKFFRENAFTRRKNPVTCVSDRFIHLILKQFYFSFFCEQNEHEIEFQFF